MFRGIRVTERKNLFTRGNMKKLTALLLLLFSNLSIAAFETKSTYIYEKHDKHKVRMFMAELSLMGITVVPIKRDSQNFAVYADLDRVTEELYQAYLKYFKLTETKFPRPYVFLNATAISANFGKPSNGLVKTTNLIAISSLHATDKKFIYAVLSHEMAHYYHEHTGKGVQYIRANYTDDRENLTLENNFGTDFENDENLVRKLETIQAADLMYEGGFGSTESLSKIAISDGDPVYRLIKKGFPALTSKTFSRRDSCHKLAKHIRTLKATKNLTLGKVQRTRDYEKECKLTKNKSWDTVVKGLLTSEGLDEIRNNAVRLSYHKNPLIAYTAKGIVKKEGPITIAFRIIYESRKQLKKMITSIDWERLQFHTPESEADVTAFKVLQSIGKGATQFSFLNFMPGRAESCIESIMDEDIEVPYLNPRKHYEIHGNTCFRVFRTKKMLEAFGSDTIQMSEFN
jgi:hypothetical protein